LDSENSKSGSKLKLKPVMLVVAIGEILMFPVMMDVGTVEMPVLVRTYHVGFCKAEADRFGEIAMNSSEDLGICRTRLDDNEAASIGRK
jgi:hypothetical protein